MKKYYVEIQTQPNTNYQLLGNWDAIYPTRREAEESVKRAEEQWHAARVAEVDVPEHVDHFYFNLAINEDATALYDRSGREVQGHRLGSGRGG